MKGFLDGEENIQWIVKKKIEMFKVKEFQIQLRKILSRNGKI